MYTGTMYTGTLISGLIAAAERVGLRAQYRRMVEEMADERELRAIFAMQIPVENGDQLFMGAA